jgi:hypothetical protein
MVLKCVCGKSHSVNDPTFAPALECDCGTSLKHSGSLCRCPWCNTPQFVEPKGTWRCPNCTGFWTYTLGAPMRRYGMPAAPYVLWIFLGVAALVIVGLIIASTK